MVLIVLGLLCEAFRFAVYGFLFVLAPAVGLAALILATALILSTASLTRRGST